MVDKNLNESNVDAKDLCRQARMLIDTANFEDAAKKLDAAMCEDPMLLEIYKNYGDLHMAKDEYAEAKKSYKQALLIEKQGELYFLYGNACFLNGNEEEGITNYNLAISNGYDNEEALFFTGMAYEHLNDDNNAVRYFYRAIQKNPARPEFRIQLISSLIQLGEVEKAEEETDELIRTSPEIFEGYHLKNLLLTHAGRLEEAEQAALKATERFPEDVDLFLDYTRIFVQKGELDRAIGLIEKAKQMKYFDRGKRDFCHLEAQIYAQKTDYDHAIKCCDECISLETEDNFDAEVRFMKLNLNYVQKKYEEALKEAVAIVDAKKKNAYYNASLYYKARCLKELNRPEEANAAYRDALAILKVASLAVDSGVDTYMYRAMSHTDLGEYDKAFELLDFVDQLNLNIAETHLMRAEIYKQQNNEMMQKKELEKAYEIKPELKPKE